MASFTIHRGERTGDIWILERDGDEVVRHYGPVRKDELQRLTPDSLHLVDFDDESIDEIWGIALEYRDGEWVSNET